MKALLRSVSLGDVLLVAGFFSLIRGVAMLSAAAAWVAAGVLLLLASWGVARTPRVLPPTPPQKTRPSSS